MARRKRTFVDGQVIDTDSDTTIRTAIQQAGIEVEPPSIVSDGEIITQADFGRPAPPHGMQVYRERVCSALRQPQVRTGK